jgi:NAD(P)-dependent dehydrogenase (short-subunit alcohol dehydrogenase family)
MAPELAGKVFLVTGANTGIGRATAQELASRGAEVVLACRNEAKAEPVIADIRAKTGNDKLSFHALDLADLAAVRESAEAFLTSGRKIDCLINNAGLAGQQGTTKDGFELGFGTNHLGHFLFTLLLLDRIRESAPARIVVVASNSHYAAKGIDFEAVQKPTRTTIGLHEYEVSKLANVLFAAELSRRLKGTGVNTYSLNPGRIASDIWRRIPWPVRPLMLHFMKSNEEGAQTSLYCATSDQLAGESGKYYNNCREKKPSRLALDRQLATRLWERSCEMVGIEDPLPLP